MKKTANGGWSIEASRDIRPDLAKLVVQDGGALKSLDIKRARLEEACTRFFAEEAVDAAA